MGERRLGGLRGTLGTVHGGTHQGGRAQARRHPSGADHGGAAMSTTTLPLDPVEPIEQELAHTHRVAGHGSAAEEWNVADFLVGTGHDSATVWIAGHHHFSFAELRGAAAIIRDELRARGVQPGDPVALLAGNGFFWIAAYLAILSAGMIAVPLSTTLRPVEAGRRARWAGCRIVALGGGQRWSREADGPPVLAEDALPMGWDHTAVDHLISAPVPATADAVYVFTSGTTCDPRAVRITHGNIRANTQSILDYLYLESTDRTLVVLPFTYVFGASLLHTHLRIGAALVHHPSAVFPETIVEALERHNCTGFAGVPAIYSALVRNSTFTLRALPQLRMLQQAGGSLPPVIDDEIAAAHPSARLFVMYGQTEATARLSYLPPEARSRRSGSIGRGIPGVQLRVVSPGGDDVSPGEVGEIWARGGNISPGYLHDDISTARKMSGGVLRTGDLATVDDDGYIYIVDRLEDFIKSWGHRVASTDVEATAMELPELVGAAAVGIADAVAGERIEMVVVRRDGTGIDEDEIIAHCRRRLPRYMVPAQVHFAATLPLNANGKVLKRAVRDELVAARTKSETAS